MGNAAMTASQIFADSTVIVHIAWSALQFGQDSGLHLSEPMAHQLLPAALPRRGKAELNQPTERIRPCCLP
jgi:hypothetical protein